MTDPKSLSNGRLVGELIDSAVNVGYFDPDSESHDRAEQCLDELKAELLARLDKIRAETQAELARIEQHGGEAGFPMRILAIVGDQW
jgi:hypothetical protein